MTTYLIFLKQLPLFLYLDCQAPFSIDIEFDALSDEGAADPAAPAMTANDKTSCGKFYARSKLV